MTRAVNRADAVLKAEIEAFIQRCIQRGLTPKEAWLLAKLKFERP